MFFCQLIWLYLTCRCSKPLLFLQSCTKVAADFVSPENLDECLRLTNQFRQLPKNHRAREDKLEVMCASNFLNYPFGISFEICLKKCMIFLSRLNQHKQNVKLFAFDETDKEDDTLCCWPNYQGFWILAWEFLIGSDAAITKVLGPVFHSFRSKGNLYSRILGMLWSLVTDCSLNGARVLTVRTVHSLGKFFHDE